VQSIHDINAELGEKWDNLNCQQERLLRKLEKTELTEEKRTCLKFHLSRVNSSINEIVIAV
jgi:hypothetical protein